MKKYLLAGLLFLVSATIKAQEKLLPGINQFADLTGTIGQSKDTVVYDISGPPDFSGYKYSLIHCQQYNYLFGSAALK